MNCSKCGVKGIKYEKIGEKQCYKCKFCDYQYTKEEKKASFGQLNF